MATKETKEFFDPEGDKKREIIDFFMKVKKENLTDPTRYILKYFIELIDKSYDPSDEDAKFDDLPTKKVKELKDTLFPVLMNILEKEDIIFNGLKNRSEEDSLTLKAQHVARILEFRIETFFGINSDLPPITHEYLEGLSDTENEPMFSWRRCHWRHLKDVDEKLEIQYPWVGSFERNLRNLGLTNFLKWMKIPLEERLKKISEVEEKIIKPDPKEEKNYKWYWMKRYYSMTLEEFWQYKRDIVEAFEEVMDSTRTDTYCEDTYGDILTKMIEIFGDDCPEFIRKMLERVEE